MLDIFKASRTDKFSCHSYAEVYAELLSGRENEIKHILEIGIQHGYSLEVWDKVFPNATLYGVDIEKPKEFEIKDNMRLIIGDAYQEAFIQTIKSNFPNVKFDLMIDDGSHRFDHMCYFAKHFPQFLAENGIMIIEDIPDYDWAENLLKILPKNLQPYAKIVDNRHINDRWDDIVVIVDTKKL